MVDSVLSSVLYGILNSLEDFITRKMLCFERLIHQANGEGEMTGEDRKDIPDRTSCASKGVYCLVFKFTMYIFTVTTCF